MVDVDKVLDEAGLKNPHVHEFVKHWAGVTQPERIEVVSASPREAQCLDIGSRKPLLAITRVTRATSGVPFEYAYDLFRADRVRLTATSSTGLTLACAAAVPDPA